MRHDRPQCFGENKQGRKFVSVFSATCHDSGPRRSKRSYRNQCQQRRLPRGGIRLSERFARGDTGTLFLKRRGDKLYFNLFADRIDPVASDTADFLKGDMAFRGKVGKNIEERKDRNDKPYTMFSAFSIKKVDENFEYQWVRFFCFDRQREEWLQPGVKVEAKGELTVSVHNGKPDISCRVEELMQYVPESDNSNQ